MTRLTLYVGATEISIGAQNGIAGEYHEDVAPISYTFPAYFGTVISPNLPISFGWGAGSPISGMGATTWSVRYQAMIAPPVSTSYQFIVAADDGIALAVANTPLKTDWVTTNGVVTRTSSSIYLEAGKLYPLTLSYFNYTGTGRLLLQWRYNVCGDDEMCPRRIFVVPASALWPMTQKTYYLFGGSRVAMRTAAGGPLTYLYGDHLGSASLTADASGVNIAEQRYKPYGEVRWSSGTMSSSFGFTGQRTSSYGTIFMFAREYLPSLGRFLNARLAGIAVGCAVMRSAAPRQRGDRSPHPARRGAGWSRRPACAR
ncbi:MAG: PA14 domain-containing protein [Thermoflexales bacterium]